MPTTDAGNSKGKLRDLWSGKPALTEEELGKSLWYFVDEVLSAHNNDLRVGGMAHPLMKDVLRRFQLGVLSSIANYHQQYLKILTLVESALFDMGFIPHDQTKLFAQTVKIPVRSEEDRPRKIRPRFRRRDDDDRSC